MAINGKYLAKTILTASSDEDVLVSLATAFSIPKIIAKKMTLITSVSTTVSINDTGFSDMFLGADNLYKLSLDENDVTISSVKIHEDGIDVFIAVIF